MKKTGIAIVCALVVALCAPAAAFAAFGPAQGVSNMQVGGIRCGVAQHMASRDAAGFGICSHQECGGCGYFDCLRFRDIFAQKAAAAAEEPAGYAYAAPSPAYDSAASCPGYADADGDGVCDNYGSGSGCNGQGYGYRNGGFGYNSSPGYGHHDYGHGHGCGR